MLRPMPRLALRLLLLALPLPVAAWGSVALADHGAHVAAASLSRALAPLAAVMPAPAPALVPAPEPVVAAPECALDELDTVSLRAAARRGRARRIVHGIRVSAATVLRLANAGARPSGRYVPSNGVRPAGLQLTGVGALGIGMRDGDVLTNAGGRAATSPGAVVGAVIGARSARTPEISGVFWRGSEPWQIVVEQPYIAPERSRAAPARRKGDKSATTRPAQRKRGV